MSNGYYDINSIADYYNQGPHGGYQYQKLDDLINTFAAFYVGENKIIPKANKEDIAFFARRAAQELHYDTLRSKKTWEFEVPNTINTVMPHDFVGYTHMYWSSPGGIKRPLYPTRLTQNPFRPKASTEPYTRTESTESQIVDTIVTPIVELQETEVETIDYGVNENTKVYVFYDGTSMGTYATEVAYDNITAFLDSQAGFTRDESKTSGSQNTYHTVVAGERWLDWATCALTGKFNNLNIKGDPSVSPLTNGQESYTNEPSWIPINGNPKIPFVTGGHPDHISQPNALASASNAGKVSYWSAQAASATGGEQFYDVGNPAEGSAGFIGGMQIGQTVTSADGDWTVIGPPPAANPDSDVLVIIFADESAPAYHGQGSNSNETDPAFNVKIGTYDYPEDGFYAEGSMGQATDASDSTTVRTPTNVWKQDYTGHINTLNSHNGAFNAFLYPKEQVKTSTSAPDFGSIRAEFVLHSLAAISSGNQAVPDGTWQSGTVPTYDISNTSSDCTPDALENNNKYWDGQNPVWGGLDQYGWGINTSGGVNTQEGLASDLGAFLATESVTTTETVTQEVITGYNTTYEYEDVTIVNESGQNFWQINDNGNVDGSYGGTTQSNFSSGNEGEPVVYDADYDHGYENISLGQRYGISPENAQVNGSYFMDYTRGLIFFNPSLIGQTVVLDYITDGLNKDGEMLIHKFAEEALYKHIAYAIVSTGSNYSPATIQMLKKERFAETRKAKLRLSNLKSMEMAQIMRNKSKWIKH